jgi:hypothetical protein
MRLGSRSTREGDGAKGSDRRGRRGLFFVGSLLALIGGTGLLLFGGELAASATGTASCVVSGMDWNSLAADTSYSTDDVSYTVTCTGITGPEVDLSIQDPGSTMVGYWYIESTNLHMAGSPPYTDLPSSFTASYVGNGGFPQASGGVDVFPASALDPAIYASNPVAGSVGLYDSSDAADAGYLTGADGTASTTDAGSTPTTTTTTTSPTTTTTSPSAISDATASSVAGVLSDSSSSVTPGLVPVAAGAVGVLIAWFALRWLFEWFHRNKNGG